MPHPLTRIQPRLRAPRNPRRQIWRRQQTHLRPRRPRRRNLLPPLRPHCPFRPLAGPEPPSPEHKTLSHCKSLQTRSTSHDERPNAGVLPMRFRHRWRIRSHASRRRDITNSVRDLSRAGMGRQVQHQNQPQGHPGRDLRRMRRSLGQDARNQQRRRQTRQIALGRSPQRDDRRERPRRVSRRQDMVLRPKKWRARDSRIPAIGPQPQRQQEHAKGTGRHVPSIPLPVRLPDPSLN